MFLLNWQSANNKVWYWKLVTKETETHYHGLASYPAANAEQALQSVLNRIMLAGKLDKYRCSAESTPKNAIKQSTKHELTEEQQTQLSAVLL